MKEKFKFLVLTLLLPVCLFSCRNIMPDQDIYKKGGKVMIMWTAPTDHANYEYEDVSGGVAGGAIGGGSAAGGLDVFAEGFWSPFMSFAPQMLPGASEHWPAVTHFDGSARAQSVSANSDPWMHRLLLAVAAHTGTPLLCNTSFNTKGRPILNRLAEALALLDTLPDLDYLLVDGWLFEKRRAL